MIAFKCITTFTPTKHGLFHEGRPARRKNFILHSKSNDSESAAPPPEGDMQKQEVLAKIAMLQTQKVRLTEFLDERSDYLTQFAEEANAEINQIGEEALKELEETSARIMGNLESQMQAFEESAESSKLEIEKNEQMLAEFEGQIEEKRNEGMFFKNLGDKTPIDKEKGMKEAIKEAKKIQQTITESAGQKTRRNIYLALIGLLSIGIVDSLISSTDYRKALVLGALLFGVLTQVIYEQSIVSKSEQAQEAETKENK